MFPAGYNNAYQILQTPGYVVILYEMIHETRVIPLTTARMSPPVSACGMAIRAATGTARRWWWTRPTTTTRAGSAPAPPPIESKDSSKRGAARLERLTRKGPHHRYEVTIDDPAMYSRPGKHIPFDPRR